MKYKVKLTRKILVDLVHEYEVEADSPKDAMAKVSTLPDDGSYIEDIEMGIELKETYPMDEYVCIHPDSKLEGIEYKAIVAENTSTWLSFILNKIEEGKNNEEVL